jgi:hypothetical protein
MRCSVLEASLFTGSTGIECGSRMIRAEDEDQDGSMCPPLVHGYDVNRRPTFISDPSRAFWDPLLEPWPSRWALRLQGLPRHRACVPTAGTPRFNIRPLFPCQALASRSIIGYDRRESDTRDRHRPMTRVRATRTPHLISAPPALLHRDDTIIPRPRFPPLSPYDSPHPSHPHPGKLVAQQAGVPGLNLVSPSEGRDSGPRGLGRRVEVHLHPRPGPWCPCHPFHPFSPSCIEPASRITASHRIPHSPLTRLQQGISIEATRSGLRHAAWTVRTAPRRPRSASGSPEDEACAQRQDGE